MGLPSKVRPGDQISARAWNDLIDYVRASALSPSNSGIRVVRAGGGITLATNKARSTNKTNNDPTPFKVVLVPAASNDGTNPAIGVVADSHILNSNDAGSYEESNSDWGLLDSDYLTSGSGNGMIDIPTLGDKIWLQVTFDDSQNITSIDVQNSGDDDDSWFPDPISINTDDSSNPYQDYLYILIAECTDPEEDPRQGFTAVNGDGDTVQVTQCLFTNLMLVKGKTSDSADNPGVPILMAIPWPHPGTDVSGDGGEIAPSVGLTTPWEFGSDDNPWLNSQVDSDAGDTEDTPPYDVLVGYGESSFASEMGNADPVQKIEIDVGNSGDGYSDGSYSSTDADSGFLLIVGDDTADNDILGFYEQAGSVEISPNTPSIELFAGLDGGSPDSIDHSSHILLDFSQLLVEITDDSGGTISLNGDSSIIAISDGSGSSIELDLSSDPIINVTSDAGSYSSLDGNSLNCYDSDSSGSFSADASDLGGDSASFQQISLYGSGGYLSTFYALCTQPQVASDNDDFKNAVEAVIEGMTATATCVDGGVEITWSSS